MLKAGAPKILVYTLTKNAACKVYEMLSKSVHNKQCVGMYHASLTPATKMHIHAEFQKNGTLHCLVSTIAFGMVLYTLILIKVYFKSFSHNYREWIFRI